MFGEEQPQHSASKMDLHCQKPETIVPLPLHVVVGVGLGRESIHMSINPWHFLGIITGERVSRGLGDPGRLTIVFLFSSWGKTNS